MKARPVVLHIVGSLEGGGAERWVQELVPRLNDLGMRSDIVTVYPPRLEPSQLAGFGCDVYHRSKRPGFDVMHFAWLTGLIRKLKPQIVHTHQWAGKYVGRSSAILANAPFIVHTEHSPLPVSFLERALAFALSWRTDAVISFNEHKASLIRARERVGAFEIIRNGIPLGPVPTEEARSKARRNLEVDRSTVVFAVVASLQERKNPLLTLRAFARIAGDARSPARLDFFGEGSLRGLLEEEARALKISDCVRFHGFRPNVRDFLPGIDVFVTLATQEMAPISMLEAMAARLPIIGTPHPGTIEMVQDGVNGVVVDWDIDEIVEAMRAARDDEPWRVRCGAAGRELVEREYDIERIAKEHIEFYGRLIEHDNGDVRRGVSVPIRL